VTLWSAASLARPMVSSVISKALVCALSGGAKRMHVFPKNPSSTDRARTRTRTCLWFSLCSPSASQARQRSTAGAALGFHGHLLARCLELLICCFLPRPAPHLTTRTCGFWVLPSLRGVATWRENSRALALFLGRFWLQGSDVGKAEREIFRQFFRLLE
jgi:hypothetical protein